MIDFKGLLAGGNENLGIEFKQWMDIWVSKSARADIAMHLAAIANHGGGFLIFGVDKQCRPQEQDPDFPAERYNQDAISGIIKRYLEPEFQCLVHMHVHENGVTYPVVEIPSHKGMPIYSTRNAPESTENSQSLRQATIYIRDVGPQSVPIRKMEHWHEISERCIQNRADIRERLQQEISQQQIDAMSKAITQTVLDALLPLIQTGGSFPGHANPPATPAMGENPSLILLKRLTEDTRKDFIAQIENMQFSEGFDPAEKAMVLGISQNHMAMGYGLLAASGGLIHLDRPMALLRQVSGQMDRYAHHGWHDFILLDSPDVAPRSRVWMIDDRDYPGVEGMRNGERTVFFGSLDYWRVYRAGVFTISKSYREDYQALRLRPKNPFITTTQLIMRMHALLAHATLTSRCVEGADRILLYVDSHGMDGRHLMYGNGYSLVSPVPTSSQRIATDLTVTIEELRADYYEALKRLCCSVLDMFDAAGHLDFDTWLTRSRVLEEFSRVNSEGGSGSYHLVDDLNA
ncbi:AlbA family DNA-binding domain-containing protein [Microvirga sp. CF3016]|uniref:AlbA family DNA-binding domain-containing protein n=1 Tax=Microvirga sp. CF3016 TaxID=3110181 RepID=UPI002E7860AA|nr:ATP-binding protein [Microvirga sp. CF3016]MEE1613419.1 ATP-binding protein [Microvirga sp. CF3016]